MKYVEVFNFDTNAKKCDSLTSGSTDATCTSSASTDFVGTYNDTGQAGGCDLFGDGHGICAHEMEPVP
jgi:hypothetical protein